MIGDVAGANKGRNDAGILQLNWQRIDELQVVGARRRSGRILHGNGVGDRIPASIFVAVVVLLISNTGSMTSTVASTGT